MYGIIYKVTCKANNKVYIGQTKNNFKTRYPKGLKSLANQNSRFASDYRHLGDNGFVIDEVFDTATTEQELDDKEIAWIQYYNSTNPQYGYNKASGGKSALVVRIGTFQTGTACYNKSKVINISTATVGTAEELAVKYNCSSKNVILACEYGHNKPKVGGHFYQYLEEFEEDMDLMEYDSVIEFSKFQQMFYAKTSDGTDLESAEIAGFSTRKYQARN